jgi:hypothetical protein
VTVTAGVLAAISAALGGGGSSLADMQTAMLVGEMRCGQGALSSAASGGGSRLLVPFKVVESGSEKRDAAASAVALVAGILAVHTGLALMLTRGKAGALLTAKATATIGYPSTSVSLSRLLLPGLAYSAVVAMSGAGGGSDQRGVGGAGLLLVAALVGLPLVAQRRLGPQFSFASYLVAVAANQAAHDAAVTPTVASPQGTGVVPWVSQYSPFLRRAVLPLGAWYETHDPPRRLGQRFGALFGASHGQRAVPVVAVLEAKVVAMAVLAALGTLGGPLATSCRAVQYAMAGLQVAGAVGVVLLTPYRVGVQNGSGALSQFLSAGAILSTAVPGLSEDASLGENLLFALSAVGMMTSMVSLLARVKEAMEKRKAKRSQKNQAAAAKSAQTGQLAPALTIPLLTGDGGAERRVGAPQSRRNSDGPLAVSHTPLGSETTRTDNYSTRIKNPLASRDGDNQS